MRFRIVSVGKLKEKYFEEAQKEYLKRLSRFAKTEVVEVKDERPAGGSEAALTAARDVEAARIRQKLRGFVIACTPAGTEYTSEEFAQFLEKLRTGAPEVTFLVGGSTGLAGDLLRAADARISFSRMTMPHRLFRIVLLEQLYRAQKIASGETYHK